MYDLRFQLSRAEFLAAHRANLGRSLLTAKTLLLLTLALGLGAVQAQLFGGKELALRVFAGLWIAIVGFIAYAYLGLPLKLLRDRPEFAGEQRLRFDTAGVTIGPGASPGPEGGELIPWEQLDGLVEKSGFLLLLRKHRLPIVVPLRALASEAEREGLRELCARSYLRLPTES